MVDSVYKTSNFLCDFQLHIMCICNDDEVDFSVIPTQFILQFEFLFIVECKGGGP